MRIYYLILVCTIGGLAAGYPTLPLEDHELESGDSSLGILLENFKNFNATNLFASFRLPVCVQDCVDELANSASSLEFDGRWSMQKTKLVCGQFEVMKNCLARKPACNSIIVEIGMHTLQFLCTDDENFGGLFPCIRREALKIHATCERACKLGATLMDAASLNSKKTDSLNFLDEKGNKILSVPDIHVLCNTSTCFLSCMRTGVDEKCPHGGSTLIDNILSTFMKRVTMNQNLPETKILDAYASMVSSVLPKQCQHLVLEDRNIILTTPGAPFTFVTASHEIVIPAVTLEAPIDNLIPPKGYSNANAREEGISNEKNVPAVAVGEGSDKKGNAASTNSVVSSIIFSVVLFEAYI